MQIIGFSKSQDHQQNKPVALLKFAVMALLAEKAKLLLILFILWCGYLALGMLVFTALEGKDEVEEEETKWNHGDSVWFSFVLLTTVGYGDVTPKTGLGKGLSILYAIFGIPLTILLLRLIGLEMLHSERRLIIAIEGRFLRRNRPPHHLHHKCFLLAILFWLLLLLVGAAVQMLAEDWSYGDSLYFYTITFMTVGFGDLVPLARYISVPLTMLGLAAVSNILHGAASLPLIRRITAGSLRDEEMAEVEEQEISV